jgi:lysophospholipase L1-like esterase
VGQRLRRLFVIVWAVAAAAGCGGSPTKPTPPPPPAALSVTCPASQAALSIQSQAVTVSWAAPMTAGGTAPVQVVCTPPPGSPFEIGASPITCTATDAAGQRATCTFSVTVASAPQLSATRFVAYGDSITWGKDAPPASMLAYPEPPPPTSFPSQLADILTVTYPGQTITVDNEGWPGETVDEALDRLPGVLAGARPEVLLILHGANDLLGRPERVTTERIAARLRDMVRTAKARVPGVHVLLATFPPQYHGTVPYDRGAGADFVPELNQRIAAVAQEQGAVLVDLYTPMVGDLKQHIGQDGLHPTVKGFTVMAETIAAAIRQQFAASQEPR